MKPSDQMKTISIAAHLLLMFSCQNVTAREFDWIASGGDFTHIGYRDDAFPGVKNVTLAWQFDSNTTKLGDYGTVLVYIGAVYYINPVCQLFSLDAKTGKLNYMLKLDTNNSLSYYRYYTIDAETGVMYASLDIGKFFAIQLSKNQAKILWIKNAMFNQIVVSSKLNRVFASNSTYRQIRAFDRSTGMEIPGFNITGSDSVYVMSLTDDQRLIATTVGNSVAEFDARGDGRLLWKLNLSPTANNVNNNFVFGNLAVVTVGNSTVAVDLDKRAVAWKTNNTVEEHCQYIDNLATDGKLVFRACLHTMYVYNLKDGRSVYSVPISPESGFDIFLGNTVVIENIAVSVIYGGLAGVDKTSGKLLFKYVSRDGTFSFDWCYSNGMFFTSDLFNKVSAFQLI